MKNPLSQFIGRTAICCAFLLTASVAKAQTVNTFTANNVTASDTITSGVLIRSQCIRATDTIRTEKDMIIDQNLRVSGVADFSNNIVVAKHIGLGLPNDFVSF